MKHLRKGLAVAAAFSAVGAFALQSPTAQAVPPQGSVDGEERVGERPDHLPNPAGDKLRAEKMNALQAILAGESPVQRNGRSVGAEVNGKFTELGVEGTDEIFVITTEFGDEIDPRYGGLEGPMHNAIPEPDRENDNSTIWQDDYNRDHYVDIYGSTEAEYPSLANFTAEQSGGKYTVSAQVSDWVQLDYNQARYGSNLDETETYWAWVSDSVEYWWNQNCTGAGEAVCLEQLAGLDQQDRYDYDADGNYQEPDGYIDHFQLIHAGVGEETGGGEYGEDAIWSHRWRVNQDDIGSTGPVVPGTEDQNLGGGAPIGDSGWWVADYTAQPENGGLGVFAHEYMHDLELPDLYATVGGENDTGFWTLMSSGSYFSQPEPDGVIGDRAAGLSAWEKAFLGWITPDDGSLVVADYGTQHAVELGAAATRTGDLPQAAVVNLPDRIRAFDTPAAPEGDQSWWSFTGDGLNTSLRLGETVDMTDVTEATIEANVAYEIEAGCACDVLYGEVTTGDPTDPNATWERLNGTVDGEDIWVDGEGITGTTRDEGTGEWGWVPLVYDLNDYAGEPSVSFRFHYATDGGLALLGFFFDQFELVADGETIFSDNAEYEGDGPWVSDGFLKATEGLEVAYPQRYWVENRQPVGADWGYGWSPYNFGFFDRPDWVEHYAYRSTAGPLVWYNWDAWSDNNTSVHPGTGVNLPIDVQADLRMWEDDGNPDTSEIARGRIQSFDAPLSLEETGELTLHRTHYDAEGEPFVGETTFESLAGVSIFDDTNGVYWDEALPNHGVLLEPTDTTIELIAMTENCDGNANAWISINGAEVDAPEPEVCPTSPPTESPTPTLPPTGGDSSSSLAGIGLAAVLAGGLLVALATRRLRSEG